MNANFRLPLRRLSLSALGLIAAAGLGWAAASTASDRNPMPEVNIDSRPLSTANSPLGQSYAPIVDRVAPSVVKIRVTERAQTMPTNGVPYGMQDFWDFWGFGPYQGQGPGPQMQIPQQQGVGSGVIVSPNGYILTNNHVIEQADEITVGLNDGREMRARVVGRDEATDVAVVKVDATGLPAITFADSDKVRVGDRVLALGNPFDVGQTVTSGMVSGLGRRTPDGEGGTMYEDFIQTDAAINPGNSGGALVDADGRLIGVNTAIVTRSGGFQGIGFAIPSNLAVNVMRQLVSNGTVVRGYLGVVSQGVDSNLARYYKLPKVTGALVTSVEQGTPAAEGGLQEGDVITRFNGRDVSDQNSLGLIVAQIAPGTTASADVYRNGKMQTMEFTVTERPPELTDGSNRMGGRGFSQRGNQGGSDTGTLDGVYVDNLNNRTRQEYSIPNNISGALIVQVDPNSAAARAGLSAGDVIQSINGEPVNSANDAVSLSSASSSDLTQVKIMTRGNDGQYYPRFLAVDESQPQN